MKKANVVFIMTDHQRADSIGMVMCGKEVTPNLNELAKKSISFSRAYNTAPLCVPARTALATGKYPTHNGVVFNDWDGIRAQNHKTIHEILSDNGYKVSHVGVDHIKVKPALKERVNFDKWIDQKDYVAGLKEKGINPKRSEKHTKEVNEQIENGEFIPKKYSNTYVSEWEHDTNIYKDSYFTEESLEVIDNIGDEPFALFINYWAPHPPLRIPSEFMNKFDPEKIELPSNVDKIAMGEPKSRRKGVAAQLAKDLTENEWKKVWAAHLGLVNYVDSKIGEIINLLKVKGLMDNTIFVFTSDHGDHLGQHSMYQKMEMYEQAVNVPLLINIPGVEPKKIDSVVSHLDLLPTLLDELNIQKPQDIDGISLYDQIHNLNQLKEVDNRKVYCQYSGNPTLGAIRRAVINSKYKYIVDDMNGQELYDLEKDPLEMINLAKDEKYKDILSDLHKSCDQWGKEKKDWLKLTFE